MKRLIYIIGFLICSYLVKGQTTPIQTIGVPGGRVEARGQFKIDSLGFMGKFVGFPVLTSNSDTLGAFFLNLIDGQVYVRDTISGGHVWTSISPLMLPNLSWASNLSGHSSRPIDTSYYRIFNVLDFGAVPDSVTDCRAAIMRTIAAMPASGGILFFPAGKYRVSDSIYINKSIWVLGTNNVIGSTFLGNTSGGSIVYGGANDRPVFVFDQDGSGNKPVIGIEHIAILSNKATTPVDGSAGVVIKGFTQQPFITFCTIGGFFRDVDIQSAFYFTISNSWIGASISSAIRINDLGRTDTGDWGIFNNEIISGNFTGTSKGIEWHSGGGLKIWGNKFDAQSFTQTTQFTYPIWISNEVDPTSDVQIIGNSIEDYQITSIYDSCKNNSTATIAHHIITNNQIAGVGSIGPGVAFINASIVQMDDNDIKDWIPSTATGMQFTNCNRVQVNNTYVVNFGTSFINSGSTIDRMDVTLTNDNHTVSNSILGVNGDVVIGSGDDVIDSGFSYLHLPGSSPSKSSLIMASGPAPGTLKKGMFYNDGAAPWYVDDALVAHDLLATAVPAGSNGDVIFKAGSVYGANDDFNWDNVSAILTITGIFNVTQVSTFGVTKKAIIFPDFAGSGEVGNSAIIGSDNGDIVFVANTSSGAAGDKIETAYYDGTVYRSAWEVANVSSGKSDLLLMKTGGTVDIGTSSPAPSAVFNVTSTTQGLLPPRMTTTQKLAITSPAEGLMVYDLTLHQMSYFNGTVWVNF